LNIRILYICTRLLFNLSAFVLVASYSVASWTEAETIIEVPVLNRTTYSEV
jgi:hypothetical protein